MRHALPALLFVLPACASPPPPRPIAGVTIPIAPLPSPAAPAPPRPPPTLPSCRVDPLPALPAPTPPGACSPIPASLAADARAKLAKRYMPTAPGAKLAVTFACDPLRGPLREIVYEHGSGHGQDLALTRLRPRDARVEALRISRPGLGPHPAPILVERATLDASALDVILPAARALVLARLEERIPPGGNERSGFFSSGDFHSRLRVEDAAGHAIERAFTGYPSSEEQLRSAPAAEIGELLYPLVEKIPWQPAAGDDDARAFFVSRYLSAGPARAEWWVKERLVILSEHAGTPALVPSLVELALTQGEHSVARTREYAVNALAALAGFDARRDAGGAARPIADAAADYAGACRR